MENLNHPDDLHHVLGIIDQNIKNIKKQSHSVLFEDRDAKDKVSS
jgi:hypothetical protein